MTETPRDWWTAPEEARLIAAVRRGDNQGQIARDTGRTHNAIRCRVRVLRLKGRIAAAPLKPDPEDVRRTATQLAAMVLRCSEPGLEAESRVYRRALAALG